MPSPESIYRVVLVCTGNTCRSPLAAAALLDELGGESGRIDVSSAGTAAWEGQPATAYSIEVASAEGVDLSGHRSRRVSPDLLRQADLVLVMERAHLAAVQALGADPKRTFVLSEYPVPGEPGLPLSDPFGGSLESYEECWRRIRRHVRRAAPHIVEASRVRSV